MMICGRRKSSQSDCNLEDTSSSSGWRDAQWVGVIAAVCVVTMVIVWLVRTCGNRNKRQRLLRKLRCLDVQEDTPDLGSENNVTGTETIPHVPSFIFFIPCPPPSYEEAMRVFQNAPVRKSSSEPETQASHSCQHGDDYLVNHRFADTHQPARSCSCGNTIAPNIDEDLTAANILHDQSHNRTQFSTKL